MKAAPTGNSAKSGGNPGPGRPRSQTVDSALREAARAEFIERGYRAMSMESIAARAGVSKISLYRRWSSKAAVADYVLSDMAEQSLVVDTGSLEGDLRALVCAAIDSPRARVEAGIIMRTIGEIVDEPELMAIYRERVLEPRLREIRALLTRALERGELRNDLTVDLAAAIVGGPLFLYYLVLLADASVSLPANLCEDLPRAILDGVGHRD